MDAPRPSARKKRTSELFWQLDATALSREDVFAFPGNQGQISWKASSTDETLIQAADYLFAQYQSEGPSLRIVIPAGSANPPIMIALTTTDLHFGGQRWWFLCPGCDRRSEILYADCPAGPFRCRVCLSLAYDSQLLHTVSRGLRTSAVIRAKFGVDLSADAPFPPPALRPRGMHMETYERLCLKDMLAILPYKLAVLAKLERFTRSAERLLKECERDHEVLPPLS